MGTVTWPEVGERVRQARLAAGMSQADLGNRVGLERDRVSKIESGERGVNALELFALADALGVHAEHFVTRPPAAMVSRRLDLDSPDAAAQQALRLNMRLEEHGRDAAQLVRYGLLRSGQIPTCPAVRTEDDARVAARHVRASLGVPSGPLDRLTDVAEHVGLFLTVVDMDADGASLRYDAYGVAVIGSRREPGRRRWNAAHEIGHHVLGDEYQTDVGVNASREEREQLVDAFAGELLLPAADLEGRRPGIDGDIRAVLVEISGTYRLSWSAVVEHARRAELVSLTEARRQRAKVPVQGEFLRCLGVEPPEDLPLGDHGQEWTRAVFTAYQDGLVTRDRAVELLGHRLRPEELPD